MPNPDSLGHTCDCCGDERERQIIPHCEHCKIAKCFCLCNTTEGNIVTNQYADIQYDWDQVCDDVRVPTITRRGRGCYFVGVVINQDWPAGVNAFTTLASAKKFAEATFADSGAGNPTGHILVGQKITWVPADDRWDTWYGAPVEVQPS